LRILIAEDDAISRMILRRAVERLGHECMVAADGIEAWEMYQESPEVDVVISNWMMPGLDGPALCKKIRNQAGSRDGYPFFVFLTTLGDQAHRLEGMQAGADDYLSKPLDRDELEVRLLAAARVTSLHRQLTEQKKELEKLNFELFNQARRDPLTRLSNRLRLREDLETMSARVERYGYSYCAMLCDVDSFKLYNDRYGHLKGDEVLRKVAEAILQSFRTEDTSYRYGGEEFLIILPEQPLESAALAAERLRCAVEKLAIPHEASEPGEIVTVSCGLAELSPGAKKTVEEVLKEADEALYQAKEGGKNKIAVSKRERATGTELEAEA
jgi:two-component system, cell cycle response regulator